MFGGAPPPVLHGIPVDIPALEVKLGALVLLLCITLLFGYAPLWLVRGAGLCGAAAGEGQVIGQVSLELASRPEAHLSCLRCRRACADVELERLLGRGGLPGHLSAGSAAGLPAEQRRSLRRRRDHGRLKAE